MYLNRKGVIINLKVSESKYENENHTPYVYSAVYLVRTKECSNQDIN